MLRRCKLLSQTVEIKLSGPQSAGEGMKMFLPCYSRSIIRLVGLECGINTRRALFS